jgi:hypothetical protein
MASIIRERVSRAKESLKENAMSKAGSYQKRLPPLPLMALGQILISMLYFQKEELGRVSLSWVTG